MTAAPRQRYWSGPRLFALAAVTLVLVIFVGANAHLIAVSYSSQPGCIPHPDPMLSGTATAGATVHRAAKSSC